MNCKLLKTFVAVISVAAWADAEPSLTHTDVFISGENGYHTYRIPAVETAPDGSLIAFCEARKYNAADPGFGQQEIGLVYKRSTNNGATWSPMTVLEHAGELWSAANPATVVDRSNGRLWVFYLRSRPGCSTETSRPGTDDMRTLARWSDTSGQTCSEPLDLTAVARDLNDKGWRASVPGPGGANQTRKGRLLVPMWKSPCAPIPIGQGNGVRLDAETDFVRLKDGTLYAALRGDRVNMHFATSLDGGFTWSPVKVIGFSGHCPHFARLSSGEILLTHRLPMTSLHVSRDEGKTWQGPYQIDATPGAYASTVELKDGSVLVVYYEEGAGSAVRARRFKFKELGIEFLQLGS